jgi:glycogen(starch) synthase
MAARLARRHPEVAYIIAGDGSRRQHYEQMARELGIERSVRFLGFVGDMRAFYAACDVVVLPSQSEGCPNVVLEAMASERPLVVSDTPATAEVLTHGREGLMHPVGDIPSFMDAVLHMVELPKMRSSLARAARARVLREFDADQAVARLARVLRGAAERAAMPARMPLIPATVTHRP